MSPGFTDDTRAEREAARSCSDEEKEAAFDDTHDERVASPNRGLVSSREV